MIFMLVLSVDTCNDSHKLGVGFCTFIQVWYVYIGIAFHGHLSVLILLILFYHLSVQSLNFIFFVMQLHGLT